MLAVAARRAAADSDGEQALADVVRIHRLGMHAASEPILISRLVGQAIDAVALGTLADVLPRLEKSDLPPLDKDSLRDFVETPVRYQRAFLGEEAFGLATLGDLSDAARGTSTMELLRSMSDADAVRRPARASLPVLPAAERYRRHNAVAQAAALPGGREGDG